MNRIKLLLLLLVGCPCAQAQRHTVLIHEIMADPTPMVGLPDAEYIELKNNSSIPVNLAGWRLQTSSATSGAFPAYILQPDSLVVLATRNSAALLATNSLGIPSFPALPNSGTLLVMRDAAGTAIHTVAYATEWYGNAVKEQGGWSLEMVDAANPCNGSTNWKAATHPLGGTPGRPNSVQAANPDQAPPALLAATAPDSLHLLLHFNEPLDSNSAASTTRYRLQPDITISSATPQGPLFQQVLLRLQTPLAPSVVYQLTCTGISDCAGNTIGSRNQVPAGLPQMSQPGDIIINEILFNPRPGGADYVELYNRSKKIIDISNLWISNRNTSGSFNTPQKINTAPAYLFPAGYAVLTENRQTVQSHYLVKNSGALWQQPLPTLPSDKGSFVLLNQQGIVIDELAYNQNWHFALLADPDGVALERIDPDGPTQEKSNWTSAAASAGFGTPTYRNSQYRQTANGGGTLEVNPKLFSPDNDGNDDFCTLAFRMEAPGYVANLRIFDAGGRQVRHLAQNQTLAQSGTWRWDGTGESGRALASGTYILLLEVFNLQGKKQQLKKTVVLARR